MELVLAPAPLFDELFLFQKGQDCAELAGCYLWNGGADLIEVQSGGARRRKRLHQSQAVTVLPGSYLGREAHGVNPGEHRVRIALVASTEECAEAALWLVSDASAFVTGVALPVDGGFTAM